MSYDGFCDHDALGDAEHDGIELFCQPKGELSERVTLRSDFIRSAVKQHKLPAVTQSVFN